MFEPGHEVKAVVSIVESPHKATGIFAVKRDRHGKVIAIGDHLVIPRNDHLSYGLVYGFGARTVRFRYFTFSGKLSPYTGYSKNPHRCMVISPVQP